ncbi:MAG: hypothetical protein JW995_11375 [Melioribacteraceae bacterium]|nr:hypothetical protein [Melioribacteraceae bacterium]
MKDQINLLCITILFLFLQACSDKNGEPNNYKIVKEYTVKEIIIDGISGERDFETSGLAWYEDKLVILPQYPYMHGENGNGLFYYVNKRDIKDYLAGEGQVNIKPEKIILKAAGLEDIAQSKGGGFEAVNFSGDNVFVTIETVEEDSISSFFVFGKVIGELDTIALDSSSRTAVISQTGIHNMGEESIMNTGNMIYLIHEANGKNVNPDAEAICINKFNYEITTIPFPNIEYRITDVTNPDSTGLFWAINYFFPGERRKLKPAEDIVASLHGIGKSNAEFEPVERLLSFRLLREKIELADNPPIYIRLEEKKGTNWEGIEILDDAGFLLISDFFPTTKLVFIPID